MIDAHLIDILIDGRRQRLGYDECRAIVMGHAAKANDCVRSEAEHLAIAGWLILQIAGDRRYGVFDQIAARLNVHANRVGRMRRYAEAYIDPATGSFCELRWHNALALAGEGPAGREPSLSAIERAVGMRGAARPADRPTEQDTEQNTERDANQISHSVNFRSGHPNRMADAVDPDDELAALAASYGRTRLPTPDAGRSDGRASGCVGATQDMLPFHLAETGRRLAAATATLERRLADGDADPAAARDLQTRLDALLAELIAEAAA